MALTSEVAPRPRASSCSSFASISDDFTEAPRSRVGSCSSSASSSDDSTGVRSRVNSVSSDASTCDGSGSGSEGSLQTTPRPKSKLTRKAKAGQAGQIVIIFDWDDTLLPTHWLRRYEHQVLDADLCALLRKVAQHAMVMLEAAMASGCTYIVTNAETGWVESSAARWVPELLPILKKVPIISARDSFAHLFPGDNLQWKVQTFKVLQDQLLSRGPIASVLALGDSDFEMEAARLMVESCQDCSPVLKTVKFQQHPTPAEHLKQMHTIAGSFEKVLKSSKTLEVVLQRKQNKAE